MSREPIVHPCFEQRTGTWQYLVADAQTKEAAIIDPVLDFDPSINTLSTSTADALLDIISSHAYTVTHILETHAHADHITASRYLQHKLRQRDQNYAQIGIGKRIGLVQRTLAQRYNVKASELDSAFDHLFDDDEHFALGGLDAYVIHLPGHTPDHIGYVIGENVFTGDSIFNPDVGSARCDFPGGSATDLYISMQKLLSLPGHYRLYTGHDYPPESRHANEQGVKWKAYTTVEEQRLANKHIGNNATEGDFVRWRTERDQTLAEPKLIHQSLQINIRGGNLPEETREGYRFIIVPITGPPVLLE